VWLDANQNTRSKTRTIYNKNNLGSLNPSDYPTWNYDGSSTGQADGENSEVFLKPVAVFKDPLRNVENDRLVLCETMVVKQDDDKNTTNTAFDDVLIPHKTNFRAAANQIFELQSVKDEKIQFGLEIEYFLIDPHSGRPLGFPSSPRKYPKPQGDYYCGTGASNVFRRDVVEKHYQCCLKAGIHISGLNLEVCVGQYEYQVGICDGIDAADHVVMSKYLLQRIAEMEDLDVDFTAKPVKSCLFNGSGMHTNISTLSSRDKKIGFQTILEYMKKLELRHDHHMNVYGDDNRERMTGNLETSSFDTFSYGVANRGASIRIPRQTAFYKYGYFEDRRPTVSACPYQVTSVIAETLLKTN
jgi:glutamine synthetase